MIKIKKPTSIEEKEIPNIDIWLNWISDDICNLKCKYCFNQNKSKKYINNSIDIKSLINTLKNTKTKFGITFAGGGEPFLIPNIIKVLKAITKICPVSFVTNLTSDKIKELNKIDPNKIYLITASLHIKELERKNLTEKFIDNYNFLKKIGIDVVVTEVAYPELTNEIIKYKEFFENKGINISFSPYIGKYNGKYYPLEYSKEEINIFGLSEEKIKQFNQKDKICNAGFNYAIVNQNGDLYSCTMLHEKLGNIYSNFSFKKKLIKCPFKFCSCPINLSNPSLFKKATNITNKLRIYLK